MLHCTPPHLITHEQKNSNWLVNTSIELSKCYPKLYPSKMKLHTFPTEPLHLQTLQSQFMLILLFQKPWVIFDSSFPSHPHIRKTSICKMWSESDLTHYCNSSSVFLSNPYPSPLDIAGMSVYPCLPHLPSLITAVRMISLHINSEHDTVLIRTFQWLLVCLLSINAKVLTMVYKTFMWLDLCHLSDLDSSCVTLAYSAQGTFTSCCFLTVSDMFQP